MKGTELELIATLSGAAATILSASVGTSASSRVLTTVGKLLDQIDSTLAPQPPASNQLTPATNCEAPAERTISVGESRLAALNQAEEDLRRLVALIGLHDGTVAINAQAATSALTAEIGELIAKHKA